MSNVPGHQPISCINSKTIAQIGNGKDNINLILKLSDAVLQYIIIRYEAVHNPAGKLYITKFGNGKCENVLRIELIYGPNPIASVSLNSKILCGR